MRNKENNGCFPTVVLEKTLESPLDSKDHGASIVKEIALLECEVTRMCVSVYLFLSATAS